ncbi:MAG TPA: type VI secretion system membrane subunit TssM [Steroidobacteraceae bacterium]|nr:type VI secretion system membrane subunit TssM [Steroidobacteraceae bacterium]
MAAAQVLKSRWLLTLFGVLLLCLLIWFAGPYLAFAEVKPFASVVGRLVAILVIFVIWALVGQWRLWRASRATTELAAAASMPATADHAAKSGGVGGADAQLAARFQEAIGALRKSDKTAKGLLELPWYMIIGPPGSGKTTALSNSGLEFPLADRFGKSAVRGVGGTRSCDWWFTTEAILLDTAGRYTTQSSDERADSAGWTEFLTLLKKNRPRRPINGVLIALSISDIAAFSDHERERHAVAIRRRLEELHRLLGIRLPVYVLLTKADLIAGFTEYFDDLDQKDRAQVWGVTFPLAESRSGRAQDSLAAEFDDLVARLVLRVPDRLQAERDLGRRRAIFAFPQQVASFKGGVTALVREIFASSTLDDRAWLRGVYLTSGTQEGTPIDRMLGALAKTFGLGIQPGREAPVQGKAFFIGRLLRDVVFGEAGLAGSDRKVELRLAAALAVLYLVIGGVVLALVAGMVISYRGNAAYLADLNGAAQRLASVKSAGSGATLADAVPSLDATRVMVDAADKYRDDVPMQMRFGLYQGKAMGAAAEDAYFREMNLSLGPAVARHLAGRIAASGTAPDQLYEYLKAYLMLADPKRLDAAQMRLITHAEWAQAFAQDTETGNRVAAHFDTLSDNPKRVRPVPADADLVAQARVSLQQASLPLLMYSRVRLSYAADTDRSISLDKELGLGAQAVMIRKSGIALQKPLPALYTRAVFDEFNTTGKLQLVSRFLDDSWVLGDKAPSVTESPRLAADVVQLYEQDYIKAWDAVLADVTVRAPRDTADAAQILGTLASPTSPLKRLLVLTEANTNLLKPTPASELQGAAAAKVGQMAGQIGGQLDKIFGGATAPKPGSAVTQHFAAVNALVAGTPPPIDRLLALMGQAQQQLQSASGLGGQPGSPAVLSAIQKALGDLQSASSEMPPVVGGLIGGLSGKSQTVAMGVAHTDLSNRYETQVVSQCRELVGTRYPFNPSSANDVTLEDFARVFGTGGLYDAFFQANLAPLVDTSKSAWRWREGAESVGGSAALLGQFQSAERIRQVFFKPGGQTPEAHFNVAPDDLDQDVDRFRLEIDGQAFEYRHGPPRVVSMAWPGGPAGAAVASFELHDGSHPQLAFQGPWALFRLLDHAAFTQALSATRFLVTFRVDGKSARVVLEAASIRNPLARQELARFHCG